MSQRGSFFILAKKFRNQVDRSPRYCNSNNIDDLSIDKEFNSDSVQFLDIYVA
jgi:hypothetical protein